MVGEQFVGRAEISVDCLQLIAFDAYYWTRGEVTPGNLFPISRTLALGLVACLALRSRYCQNSVLAVTSDIHMHQRSINYTGPRGGSVRAHAHGSVDVSIGLMQIDKAPSPVMDDARSVVATVGD